MKNTKTLVIVIIIILSLMIVGAGITTYILDNYKGMKDVSDEFTKILSEEDAKKVTIDLVKKYLDEQKITYQELKIVSINSLENKVEAIVEFKKNQQLEVIIINKSSSWIIYTIDKKD